MVRPNLPVALTIAFLSVACSQTPGPGQVSAAQGVAGLRLNTLTTLDQRVAEVAWRLSEANAQLCPAIRQSAGWMLHSARQYSPELRPHAEARFGLLGDLPGVLAVPAGSPAALAGFRTGDLLLEVNGVALKGGDADGAAAFEGLEANLRVIDAALGQGPTVFEVKRAGERIRLQLQPQRACGYDVQLDPSDELNARADGRRLFISTALASFAETNDELAVILGHELAHHVLRHRHWNDMGGVGRELNESDWPTVGGEGGPEQKADRVGVYLAARAGFDPSAAVPFWRRFGESNWRVRFPQIGHPSAGARARALEAVEREIAAKRASAAPLLP
jgi:hypothetical protein